MLKSVSLKGFTLVEVILVIALASILFIAVVTTLTGTIASQRYHDSVQNFTEFLRAQYSAVINIQNIREDQLALNHSCTVADYINNGFNTNSHNTDGTGSNIGRSNCAIYGKLITFGEDSDGNGTADNTIYSYDVIGLDVAAKTYNTTTAEHIAGDVNLSDEGLVDLYTALPGVTTVEQPSTGASCSITSAGNYASYQLPWQAYVTPPDNGAGYNKTNPYKAAILIMRSPVSGVVHTYVMKNPGTRTVEVQQVLDTTHNCGSIASYYGSASHQGSFLTAQLVNFEQSEINYCVTSDDIFSTTQRRNIRIAPDAHNYTSVILVDADLDPSAGGNKCL